MTCKLTFDGIDDYVVIDMKDDDRIVSASWDNSKKAKSLLLDGRVTF